MRRNIFQAIADPTRQATITFIALQAITSNAIADKFNTTRQAVFKTFTDFGSMRIYKTRTERPGDLLFTDLVN